MTSSELKMRLAEVVERRLGLLVSRGGAERAVTRFLEQNLRELGPDAFERYVDQLAHCSAHELDALVEAVTVPHSWLYRDATQWAWIERFLVERSRSERVLRIWVPACATGEDVYTTAMVAMRTGVRVEVHGTDINRSALETAARGLYNAWAVREVPPNLRHCLAPTSDNLFRVRDDLRADVRFCHHNLMDPAWSPDARPWDIILCRNVLFYFAQSTTTAVVERLVRALDTRGVLVLGASDLVHVLPPGAHLRRIGERSVVERMYRTPTLRPRLRTKPESKPRSVALEQTRSMVSPNVHRSIKRSVSPVRVSSKLATDADSLRPLVHLRAGIACHLAGDAARAIHELRAALFLEPTLWPAAYYLAVSFERTGRFEEAIREYERAARLARETSGLPCIGLPSELHEYRDDLIAHATRKAGNNLP